MNFNTAGWKDGLLKFGKVILYVAAAGALTAIVEWLGGLQIDASNYTLVAIVGLVNALLAGILKWLSIKK